MSMQRTPLPVPSLTRGPRFLSRSDVSKLVAAAPDATWRAFLLTAVYTGMRPRELLDLRWCDIDFDARTITVRSRPVRHGALCVPMHQVVIDCLMPLRRGSGRVFPFSSRSVFSHRFRQIAVAAGVQAMPYDLRRYCVAALVSSGAPLRVVQRILCQVDPRLPAHYRFDLEPVHHEAIAKLPDVTREGKAVKA